MVYTPFGKDKKAWPSVEAYQADLKAFREANKSFPFAEVDRMWFGKPEHMGAKGYADYGHQRDASNARDRERMRQRQQERARQGPKKILRQRPK